MSVSGSDAERSFTVTLMRPVFQTAEITVNADSTREAVALALIEAEGLPEQAWIGGFDGERYTYNVVAVASAVECDDDASPAACEDASYPALAEDVRYLVLRADVQAGEGAVLHQPWFTRETPLMVADLAADWRDAFDDMSGKGFDDFAKSVDE